MSKSNDTPLNILASYAYLGGKKAFAESFFSAHAHGLINGMIDSGAFTKFNSKQNFQHLNINDYCEWLKEYGNYCEKYVMLDVVGNAMESRRNYERMVASGLQPMYVLTMYDNDWDYLNQTLKVNRNVCVAGGATTKGDWMKQRYQLTKKNTNQQALIHGLAYVTFPTMYQLPLTSVDSSSWMGGSRFGNLYWFDPQRGVPSINRLKIFRKQRQVPRELTVLLDRWEVSLSDFKEESNWSSFKAISMLSSVTAFLEYQRYSYRQGLRLFLAVSDKRQLDMILYVAQNYKTITYEEYRKTV